MSSSYRRRLAGLGIGIATWIGLAAGVHAAAPQFSTGVAIDPNDLYSKAQPISDPFESKAIYGKLQGTYPVEIYSFTPSRDGTQTFILLGQQEKGGHNGSPLLILMDPTTNTQPVDLPLPLPGQDYHSALITPSQSPKSYFEPGLIKQFTLLAQDDVKLKKGAKYYLLVVDPDKQALHYAVKLGSGVSWSAGDVFHNLPAWFRVHLDTYSGTTPYAFSSVTLSLLVFLIGLLLYAGIFVVQQSFSLLSNRSKAAGFLLVKLQPFARAITWIGLWFTALGGYLYFHAAGWTAEPFIMILLFLPLVAVAAYETWYLGPRLAVLELNRREAAIPLALRRRSFLAFLVSLFALLAFLTYLSMYLVR